MYYEINVSLNGKHLFATAERSITTPWKAEELYAMFLEKFPAIFGYEVSVTKWDKVGTPLKFKNGRLEA